MDHDNSPKKILPFIFDAQKYLSSISKYIWGINYATHRIWTTIVKSGKYLFTYIEKITHKNGPRQSISLLTFKASAWE